jgi:hypothetical protein
MQERDVSSAAAPGARTAPAATAPLARGASSAAGRAVARLLHRAHGRRMAAVPVRHACSGAMTMSRVVPCFASWLAAAMLFLAPPTALPQTSSTPVEDVISRADAVRSLTELSKALWPGWDVSKTPVALYQRGDACYVLGHPDPPPPFAHVHIKHAARGAVYRAPADQIDPASGLLAGVPTAFIDLDDFSREAVPTLFREAFRAHQAVRCPKSAKPVDLLAGYPLDPRNLALVDIECELLSRAVLAPDDSLKERALEFACVSSLRRIGLTARVRDYEAQLEFLDGVSAYIAERVRSDGGRHVRGRAAETLADAMGTPTSLARCLTPPGGLDWYRRDRFAHSGAALCALLDRFSPDWKTEASKECSMPFDILWELTRREIPKASEVLARFGLEQRVALKADFVDASRSPGERLFDSIAKQSGPLLMINTRSLTGASVSYDPENIERVDPHREVHKRMIKIEYTDGTRVEISQRPIAVILGSDEFDIDQLIIEPPTEYAISVGGEPLTPEQGVHQINQPLSVVGPGLLIEAQTAIIVVGENRVTFVLQR